MGPYAPFSSGTRGQDKSEPLYDMRLEYQRDKDRILHSEVFWRLKHKTQVFLVPEGDRYRTRLTHTLEASQIVHTIAKTPRLNESLTEAIALGHDLRYTPFGHFDEYILNKIYEDGFARYQQGVRIAETLGKDERGLNFIWEVRDGVLNHRTSDHPSTLEGAIVRLPDKIAYINHNTDDTIRARMFTEDELPGEYAGILGRNIRECLNSMIHDTVLDNMDKSTIIMSEGTKEATQGLRRWMPENVYKNEIPKVEEGKAQNMIRQPYEYHVGHVDRLPMEYVLLIVNEGEEGSRVTCDYIAGMNDIYVIDQFEELFVPKRWNAYRAYKYRREVVSYIISMKSQKR